MDFETSLIFLVFPLQITGHLQPLAPNVVIIDMIKKLMKLMTDGYSLILTCFVTIFEVWCDKAEWHFQVELNLASLIC